MFGSLLDDEKGGHFSLHATGAGTVTKQMYLPDTAILVTRYSSETGVAEVQDFMPVDHPHEVTDRHRLVRVIQGIRGKVEFDAHIEPRFDYGRATTPDARSSGGTRQLHHQRPDAAGDVAAPVDARRGRGALPVHRQGRRLRGVPGRVR